LVQQQTLIQNVTNVHNTFITKVTNNRPLVAPLAQVDRKVVRLEHVAPERRLQEQREAAQFRELSQHRHHAEEPLPVPGGTPARPADAVRRVKLALPRGSPPMRTPPPPHAEAKAGPVLPAAKHAPEARATPPAPHHESPPAPHHEASPPAVKKE